MDTKDSIDAAAEEMMPTDDHRPLFAASVLGTQERARTALQASTIASNALLPFKDVHLESIQVRSTTVTANRITKLYASRSALNRNGVRLYMVGRVRLVDACADISEISGASKAFYNAEEAMFGDMRSMLYVVPEYLSMNPICSAGACWPGWMVRMLNPEEEAEPTLLVGQ